jgi:hypothetical protein
MINKNNTLIILDYDNTLFPTTWVIKNNINLMNPEVREKYYIFFNDLDKVLYKFLENLKKYGKIIIVTNALPMWVNVSSIVLPKTHILLQKIKIVSARHNYQHKSKNPMDWKRLAFQDEVSLELKKNKFQHIISIGDADYEYHALINLYNYNKESKKLLKNIKFLEEPHHDILIDQIEVLNNIIDNVIKDNKHLDLKFNFFNNNDLHTETLF